MRGQRSGSRMRFDEFPIEPDAALVIARADQMMVLGEATGAVHLGAAGLPL